MRIGNLSLKTDFKLKSIENLKWTNSMKKLGITVTTDRKEMLTENFEELISRMKKTLNPWTARALSIPGKIAIINSLLVLQAVYKLLSLNMPEQGIFKRIKEIILNFLWGQKKAKIAYKTLIQKKKQGGLQLVDLQKKDQALKCSWIKKAQDSKNIWLDVAKAFLPMELVKFSECNLNNKHLEKMNIPKDSIIYSVLKAWGEVHAKEPQGKSEILNQNLWYNSNILWKKQPYMIKQMHRQGVQKIRDIFNEHTLTF